MFLKFSLYLFSKVCSKSRLFQWGPSPPCNSMQDISQTSERPGVPPHIHIHTCLLTYFGVGIKSHYTVSPHCSEHTWNFFAFLLHNVNHLSLSDWLCFHLTDFWSKYSMANAEAVLLYLHSIKVFAAMDILGVVQFLPYLHPETEKECVWLKGAIGNFQAGNSLEKSHTISLKTLL